MKTGNDKNEIILNTEGIGVTYQESIIALKNVSLNVSVNVSDARACYFS